MRVYTFRAEDSALALPDLYNIEVKVLHTLLPPICLSFRATACAICVTPLPCPALPGAAFAATRSPRVSPHVTPLADEPVLWKVWRPRAQAG